MSDQPIKVFETNPGLKIILTIALGFITLLVITAGIFFYFISIQEHAGGSADLLIPITCGFGALILIYVILSILKDKTEIWAERIRITKFYKTSQMLNADVSNFELIQNRNGTRVKVFGKVTENSLLGGETEKDTFIILALVEFKSWNISIVRDPVEIKTKEEHKHALEDEKLGSDETERKETLQKARRWGNILNISMIVISGWGWVYPKPYSLVVSLLMIMPIIAFGVVIRFKGALRFDAGTNKVYTSVATFLYPIVILALRAYSDRFIMDQETMVLPVIIFTLIFVITAFYLSLEVRNNIRVAAYLLVGCLLFGYGTSVILNDLLDKEPSRKYVATVLNKRSSQGNRTVSYYMTLAPWGSQLFPREYKISSDVYYDPNNKYSVQVRFYNGAFHIPFIKFEGMGQ